MIIQTDIVTKVDFPLGVWVGGGGGIAGIAKISPLWELPSGGRAWQKPLHGPDHGCAAKGEGRRSTSSREPAECHGGGRPLWKTLWLGRIGQGYRLERLEVWSVLSHTLKGTLNTMAAWRPLRAPRMFNGLFFTHLLSCQKIRSTNVDGKNWQN